MLKLTKSEDENVRIKALQICLDRGYILGAISTCRAGAGEHDGLVIAVALAGR